VTKRLLNWSANLVWLLNDNIVHASIVGRAAEQLVVMLMLVVQLAVVIVVIIQPGH